MPGPTESRIPQWLDEAARLQRAGQLEQAAGLYAQVLGIEPQHVGALRSAARIAHQLRDVERADQLLNRALDIEPGHAPTHNQRGVVLAALRRYDDAIASYDRAIALSPGYVDAFCNRGVALASSQRLAAAVESFDLALAGDPEHAGAHFNKGVALADLGRREEAIASYERAIAAAPQLAAAHFNRAVALAELQRFDEAIAGYAQAIAIKPDYAAAHFNQGIAQSALARHQAALASFDRALALRPGHAPTHYRRGCVLHALQRHAEAIASYDAAIAIKPDDADAHNNRGTALQAMNRFADAVAGYDRAIALNPRHAGAWSNRGCALHELQRFDDAVASFDQALAIESQHRDALYNRGRTLLKCSRYAEAASSLERLLAVDPQFPFAEGILLHARMLCCDWRGFAEARMSIQRRLRAGEQCVTPFDYQAVSDSEADLRACAEIYAAAGFARPAPLPARKPVRVDRITVGYLCGEFRQQATTVLMCGVYENHDKAKFRLVGLDNGWDDGSLYRQRVNRSFDAMLDIRALSDLEVAQRIRAMNIDVLVNLNGYFGEARQGVFAYRPAPVQVNYLGFPGTIGVDTIDYLIADRIVVPEASRQHYTEKIVYLPECYQANDRERPISARPMTRAEFGLPDQAFVYCCFNNTYKITPEVFDSWLRILQQVPESALWLLDDNAAATANLIAEAARRGVARERLIFSARRPLAEHVARHRLADLFLDTLPYNAHTTASDALWAGLPVLTQTGTTFPARVGTSLLQALDLPELVTDSRPQYESRAVELARDRPALSAITARLARNRLGQPLFDTVRFTRHLEAAYRAMVDRWSAGLAPEHLSVGAMETGGQIRK